MSEIEVERAKREAERNATAADSMKDARTATAGYKIDLNVITLDARIALGRLDDTFVGTPN